MSANTLTVRLVGLDEDNGLVRFEDFTEFCENVAQCLRKAESIISDEPARIRYKIAGLQAASAAITLEAIPARNGRDLRGEMLKLFRNTVTQLQAGRRIDRRVDRETLEAFRKLIRPLHRRTKQVWVESACLTTQYEANIDRIVGSSIPSEGSVAGILEMVNVHNRNEFALYPPIPGYRIRCSFPESMLEQVCLAIKRNVTIWGTLYFEQERPFPHKVHVERMEVHPPDDDLPSLRELRGAAPDCTGALSAVEFVRGIRDEQQD